MYTSMPAIYQTLPVFFPGGFGNATKYMCSSTSVARYKNALDYNGKCGAGQYGIATQIHLFHSNKYNQDWCCGQAGSGKINITVTKAVRTTIPSSIVSAWRKRTHGSFPPSFAKPDFRVRVYLRETSFHLLHNAWPRPPPH